MLQAPRCPGLLEEGAVHLGQRAKYVSLLERLDGGRLRTQVILEIHLNREYGGWGSVWSQNKSSWFALLRWRAFFTVVAGLNPKLLHP